MKLVMTLLARDEADVIATNLEYHLAQGVDLIVATANNSEDGTYETLEHYAREGHVHLIWEPSDDYAQGPWVTRMARLAATEHGADWVMHSDADEFWWPRQGTLKEIFAMVPEEYGLLYVPTNLFVPRAVEAGSFLERMVVAEVASVMGSGRPHPPKVAHRAVADVEVAFGNHSATGTDLTPVPGWQPVEIMHFPMRSYAQYERKVRNGGKALRANPQKLYEPLKVQYRLWEAGELPKHYAVEKTVSDEEVEAGLRDGRLLVDRRLQRFLADSGAPARAGAPGPAAVAASARPAASLDREQIRVAALRAIDEQSRRERAEERLLAGAEARVVKAERRAERAERGRERAIKRLRALEGSAWWRLGLRLFSLRALGPPRRLAARLRARP
jgi:hypothetical protein